MTETASKNEPTSLAPVWIGLAAAFVLWTINFGYGAFNFWLLMTISTLLLGGMAVVLERETISVKLPWWKITVWGVGSAIVLYMIFFVGDIVTGWLPMQDQQVSSVYDTRSQAPKGLIIALLIFPIASGEEVFWRGYVQRKFSDRFGWKSALVLTTVLYGLVHIASMNLMLIVAAVVCGIFWGLLYRLSGCIWPGIISHIVWDVMIFALFPLR